MMKKEKFEAWPTTMVKLVSSDPPKWTLHAGAGNEVLATIECPCNAGGRLIGMPDKWEGFMCDARSKGKRDNVANLWNARLPLATMKILNCWEKKCSAESLHPTLPTNTCVLACYTE